MKNARERFAKDLLDLLLSDIGTVIPEWEVAPLDAQRADLHVEPHLPPDAPALTELGWLGHMVASTCLLELASTSPKKRAVEELQRKLLTARAHEHTDTTLSTLPMWVLCAQRPARMIRVLGMVAMPAPWPLGFYCTPGSGWLRVVSIPALPETSDTLLLRLLGRGTTRERADLELTAMASDPRWKRDVTRLTKRWALVQNRGKGNTEDSMVDMTIVDEWEKKVRAEERQAGRAEATRALLMEVLSLKGWPLDVDTQRRIAVCADETILQRWFTRAVTASDLAAVFA